MGKEVLFRKINLILLIFDIKIYIDNQLLIMLSFQRREVMEIKQLNIRVDAEILKELKIIAIKKDTSIQKIVYDLVVEYVKQNKDK